MRLPEPLFRIINPTIKLVLRSPLHFLMSGSLLIVTFTGRRSGRTFSTPVRYVRRENTIRCFTQRSNQWWRNLRGNAPVSFRIRGTEHSTAAHVLVDEPDKIREQLVDYFAEFPQDAAYHEIRLDSKKNPVHEDVEAALATTVIISFVVD